MYTQLFSEMLLKSFHLISPPGPSLSAATCPQGRRVELGLQLIRHSLCLPSLYRSNKELPLRPGVLTPHSLIPPSSQLSLINPPPKLLGLQASSSSSSLFPPLTGGPVPGGCRGHGGALSPWVSLAEPGTTAQRPRLPHSVWGGGADVHAGGLRRCGEAMPRPGALFPWGTEQIQPGHCNLYYIFRSAVRSRFSATMNW